MLFVQSSRQADGKWAVIQQDRYTMPVNKLCNRLNARAGIRGEYTAALRKHGSIIIERQGQIVKLEIKLEEKDEKHTFTGVTRDFTAIDEVGDFTEAGSVSDSNAQPAAAEGDQVHP